MRAALQRASYGPFPLHGVDSVRVLVFVFLLFAYRLESWIIPGSRCYFWYHLDGGFKRAEAISKGDVKVLQTIDWLERVISL